MSRFTQYPNASAVSMAALVGALLPSCLTAQSDRRTLAGDNSCAVAEGARQLVSSTSATGCHELGQERRMEFDGR
jgi:hypothetical protein